MARTKKTPKNGRRRAPQQEEIEGTRSTHPRIEPLAKKYSAALDDLALQRKDVDQHKRLVLAAMQSEGIPVYRLPDGKHQLRLDNKVNVKRERAAKPKKRDASGKLMEVEASR
jgi:hypothetical protein